MSGGYWNYKDETFCEDLIQSAPSIIKALKECFGEVDWSESGDTSREYAEKKLYDIILRLGNDIFG